jgi:PAS domain S-box-containing protein
VLPLREAAALLRLPSTAVEALVGSGYLVPSAQGPAGPEFPLPDLKAFLARNADNGSGNLWQGEPTLDQLERVDPQDLLDALDGRADEMAKRVYDIFSTVFPEAANWGITEQARFIEQAKSRFEAILAVTGQGAEVDEALVGDLQEVGASAAWAGSPLPQLLVILRISRDLVVQTAVELAEERSRHWGLALSLLLTRVLPAMDRLTDALAQGYCAATLGREEESRARHENVVEHSSDGIYEVDLDGAVQYANRSLALILGYRLEQVQGARLSDVLRPLDPSVSIESLMHDLEGADGSVTMEVARADGIRRVIDVQTMPRRRDDEVVGFQGIVRDRTAERELEAGKNEFLALVTHDLRSPLSTILGLAATLESLSGELPADRTGRMGRAIRGQAERMARLADDLYDVSRLESRSLSLSPRPVELAAVANAAHASVSDASGVELRVPAGLLVMADPRRLEQIIANLVENAVEHGAPPVVIEGRGYQPGDSDGDDGTVMLSVSDHGEGVNEALVSALFSGLRTRNRPVREGARGTGLGLYLVRGLFEAMGGRVWYEPIAGGGSAFRLSLPAAPEAR